MDDLRAAIETALRRRHAPRVIAVLWESDTSSRKTTVEAVVVPSGDSTATRHEAHAPTEADALRALAVSCGLRDDGGDPAEEVERLAAERALVDAEWRRDMADLRAQMERARHEATKDYDASRAEIERLRTDNASLDDVAKGALDDLAMARAELDATRAAVRAFAPQCSQCEALATRRLDGYGDGEAARCDGCSPSPMEHSWSHDLPHAAAIRAAGGVR
mgnify:CR=1 FL=1